MATLLTLCFSSAVALLSAQFLKDILILQCSDPQQSSNSFTFTKMLADQESTRNRYVAYDTPYVLCKHLILSISSFMDDGIMSPRGAQLQEGPGEPPCTSSIVNTDSYSALKVLFFAMQIVLQWITLEVIRGIKVVRDTC